MVKVVTVFSIGGAGDGAEAAPFVGGVEAVGAEHGVAGGCRSADFGAHSEPDDSGRSLGESWWRIPSQMTVGEALERVGGSVTRYRTFWEEASHWYVSVVESRVPRSCHPI